jgi:hypothetical protein
VDLGYEVILQLDLLDLLFSFLCLDVKLRFIKQVYSNDEILLLLFLFQLLSRLLQHNEIRIEFALFNNCLVDDYSVSSLAKIFHHLLYDVILEQRYKNVHTSRF